MWVGFNLFVLVLLALDLGVFHRKSEVVSVREALSWSAAWIGLALTFNVGIWVWRGPDVALEFLTGYLLEKSLGIDNIFVFILIFAYFQVDPRYQHKVLFWGILTALILRAILIVVGAALIQKFHSIIFVFGAFLVFTGIRMAVQSELQVDPDRNPLVRLVKRFLPVTPNYVGDRFLTRINGRLWATPLLVALLVVELSDIVFAVDSIPAIFAVTTDPFIVYTSNVFAILGLRSLFFALAGVMNRFYYLKFGLSVVLVFVGAKMLISDLFKFPAVVSLGVLVVIVGTAAVASVLRHRKSSTENRS
jgi:tellurite resistance protein TerC